MAGGDEGVGVEETAEFGVIISALQVIKLGFFIVVLAIWRKNEDFRTSNARPYGWGLMGLWGTVVPRLPWFLGYRFTFLRGGKSVRY